MAGNGGSAADAQHIATELSVRYIGDREPLAALAGRAEAGQVWQAAQALGHERNGERAITNVVMMGMGEPLLNLDAVAPALRLMRHDWGFGLGAKRVTVSTAGLVPGIQALKDEVDVALAVSLHAPDDALREQLVPLNRKYPIAELMAACAPFGYRDDLVAEHR